MADSEIEQRPQSEPFGSLGMARLGRQAGKQTMVERTGAGRMQNSGRGSRHESVEQDGNLLHAGRKNGAADRGELASADPSQSLQRIAEAGTMKRQPPIHDLDFSRH